MDILIIFFAKYLIWIIVAAALPFLFFSHEWKRLSIFAAISLVLAYVVGKVAGLVWYDARPFVVNGTTPLVAHAADNGFPSDHMLMAATIASIVFVYNRTLGLLLWVLAIAVGVGRVLAGVHHTVDILASAAIAIVVVAVVEYLLRRSAIL
jgi:undecaprenyl-diphosphatase